MRNKLEPHVFRNGMRKLGLAAFVTALASQHGIARASDFIAVVDLEFVEATDKPASVMCFGEGDSECAVWATLNLYKAEVRKVISGTEARKTMFVLFGRHALKKGDLPGVVASMNRLEAASEDDPRYQIFELGRKRQLVCFSGSNDDPKAIELRERDEDSLLRTSLTKPHAFA